MKQGIKFLTILFFVSTLTYGQENRILVTETTVKVSSMGTEVLYFGFEEGDQIIFNYEIVKGKDLKEIEIFEYPSSSVFMDFKTKEIKDKIIQINKKGVYKFNFKNSAVGIRICKIKIERIPANPENESFNSTVYWKTMSDTSYYTVQEKYLIKKEYLSKTIIPSTDYFINSGSNATFKGGKSRISFPIALPKNTIEWYYQFSATRDNAEINKTMGTFNLAGQLTNLIDNTGALKFGIEALTQPPGANYCDIYLLDHQNSSLFESKVEYTYYTSGTRKNIKSGLVKITGGIGPSYYIGIKNPDSMHGIHVAIEVVAVVLNEEWGFRDIRKFNVKTWEKPYLLE